MPMMHLASTCGGVRSSEGSGGLSCGDIQARHREGISLTELKRLRGLMNLGTNICLRLLGEPLQNGRDGASHFCEEIPVGIAIWKALR